MSLREDNGPYCLIWLGVLLMGAYYTNFAYILWTIPSAAATFFAATNFILMIALMILPPVMVFFFIGYLRPTRGKAKMTMLGPSVFLGLLYVIFIYTVSSTTAVDIIGDPLFFSAWGIGSAILTAGGFSIVQSYEQSTSPGMLDVSSLHYGPPKEEEVEEEVTEPETPTEPVVEASEEEEADSDESKPAEPVSE
ncbi:MAG: hypothetical protein RTV72_08665 [Candidatus Thorarchaeota archaeon]